MNSMSQHKSTSDPILTFHWRDSETTAEGWLIVDSIVNNFTGGGCIMSVYLTEHLLRQRAANQTRKMALCSPPVGGGKAGIRFPAADPRAFAVLSRFVAYFRCFLENNWVFAGDLSSNCSKMFVQCLNAARIPLRFAPEIVLKPHSLLPLSLGEVVGGYGAAVAVDTLKNLSPEKYQSLPSVAIHGIDVNSLALAFFLENKSIAKVVALGDSTGMIFDSNGLSVVQLVNSFIPSVVENQAFQLAKQKDIESLFSAEGKGFKIIDQKRYPRNSLGEFFETIPTFDILCLCAADSRYQLTEAMVKVLLKHHNPKAVISTVESPFGKLVHHPVECSRFEADDQASFDLIARDIRVVTDCVSTIATNQLYQLSWIKRAALNKMTESEILNVCVRPIRASLSK